MIKSNWFTAGLLAGALAMGVVSVMPLRTALAEGAVAATSVEHQAEAAKLDQEAAHLEAKAALHAKEAQQYRSGAGGSKQATSFLSHAAHCDGLAKSYRGAAREARALAASHRAMAKGT